MACDNESPMKRKASVEDMQARYESFLRHDESQSFKPKQQPRASVAKMLNLMDNQVPKGVRDCLWDAGASG